MSYRAELRDIANENHGVVTVRAAQEAGVPAVEVRKLAHRGALERLGYGVYRMVDAPRGPLDEFAEAVALVGEGALLADEAVLAAYDLGQVNLRRIPVATSARVRRALPRTIQVVHRDVDECDRSDVDGIPAMTVAAALRQVAPTMLPERVARAALTAAARGLISEDDKDHLTRPIRQGVA